MNTSSVLIPEIHLFNCRNFIYEYKAELDRLDTILQYELLTSKCHKEEDIAYRRYHQRSHEIRLRYDTKNQLLFSELSRWKKDGKFYVPRSRL